MSANNSNSNKNLLDSLENNNSFEYKNNDYSSTESNTSSIWSTISNLPWFTWVLIFFVLAILGFNILNYLSEGVDLLDELSKKIVNVFRRFMQWVFSDKNQYSSNIISLNNGMLKNGKAMDKAIINHAAKQTESNGQSNSSIDKPLTNKPDNQVTTYYRSFLHLNLTLEEFEKLKALGYSQKQIDSILDAVENYKKNKDYTSLYLTAKKWLEREKKTIDVNAPIKRNYPVY